MSRCQICNYCEATGSTSLYESTEAIKMTVSYRKATGQDLCEACWEATKLNRNTYRFEQMEKSQIEFDWNEREYEDDPPPWEEESERVIEEMERNTPALSEV